MASSVKCKLVRPKSAMPSLSSSKRFADNTPKYCQSLRRPKFQRPQSAVESTKKQYGSNYKFCKTFQRKFFANHGTDQDDNMVNLVLTMDQYGDGKVATPSSGIRSKKTEKGGRGRMVRRSRKKEKECGAFPRTSHRASVRKQKRSVAGHGSKGKLVNHRECMIHHEQFGTGSNQHPTSQGADAIYISQHYKELGSEVPKYKNIHNNINIKYFNCMIFLATKH